MTRLLELHYIQPALEIQCRDVSAVLAWTSHFVNLGANLL